MDYRNEADKRKLEDFRRHKHLKRHEKKLYARRQYQNTPASERYHKSNQLERSTRSLSPTTAPYAQPSIPLPSSPTVDSECILEKIQVNSQMLPTRLTSSMVHDCLTVEDKQELSSLLHRKLLGIPTNHLPDFTLTDILYQSPKATYLPHIPSDLQLPFFLAARNTINYNLSLAVKDESQQSLNVTRAIFFYRLDHHHQFVRYHDFARWNIAIYLSLLCSPSNVSNSTSKSYSHSTSYLSPAGRRFALAYLNAVRETHNSPYTFTHREQFVRLWKESRYDFFTVMKSGQKAFLKKEMVRLKREWEHELDRVRGSMGEEAYWSRVAPFVGCLVAGRVDQGRREATVAFGFGVSGMADGRVDGYGDVNESNGDMERERNKLLEGLRVPLDEKVVGGFGTEYETVVELTVGLNAVKTSTAKGMLVTLLALL